jgi:hypothetical protein
VRINHSAQWDIKHDTTFAEIYDAVAVASTEVPPEATVSVEHYPGDQRDPGYTHLKFRWTTGESR